MTIRSKDKKVTTVSFLLIFSGFFLLSCEDLDLPEDTPECVEKRIKAFNRGEACDTGASVVRYNFQGSIIYIFNLGSCGADMTATVIDKDCNNICALGGIAGNIVCNGDTISEATNRAVIWNN